MVSRTRVRWTVAVFVAVGVGGSCAGRADDDDGSSLHPCTVGLFANCSADEDCAAGEFCRIVTPPQCEEQRGLCEERPGTGTAGTGGGSASSGTGSSGPATGTGPGSTG